MCICCINIKGGQVYPVPPQCWMFKRRLLPGSCVHPLGWPLCRRWPLFIIGLTPRGPTAEVGRVLVGWGENLICGVERLPEQRQAGPDFPLRSLHTDFLCRHLWPSDAPVCGPHQSDCNPTLDVSTRLWVWLLSLWCEATGYPFQGSRRLHSE